jgi:hypothetical protein
MSPECQAQYQRDADVDRRPQPIAGSIAHRAVCIRQMIAATSEISTRHTALQALTSDLTRIQTISGGTALSAG